MSSVKVSGINKLKLSVRAKLLSITKDKEITTEIADFSVDRIKALARSSMPMRDGRRDKFPEVKTVTANRRKSTALYNRTHTTFGRDGKKRNLTITGQLIEHTKYKIKDNVIDIFINGTRLLYKGKNGRNLNNQEKNSKDIYRKLLIKDRDYSFLGMDRLGVERIKNIIKRNLRRLLK